MTVTWVSDPHLDRTGPAGIDQFHSAVSNLGNQTIVLTGDLSNATRLVADLEHLADAHQGLLYFVLGNHDHYGSSVGAVRDAVIALATDRPQILWLPPMGVIELPDGRALVGVDGWADGQHGDPLHTPLVLNDDRLIDELAQQSERKGKLAVKQVLANADAERLDTLLNRAIDAGHDQIVIATHIPPFVEALAPGHRAAQVDWHPLLVCGATGTVLRRTAVEHRDVHFQVLAGHSHQAHQVSILPNLEVRVAAARYGHPTLSVAEQ